MTSRSDKQLLIEQASGAYRTRGHTGTIDSHPAWHDLDDAGRHEVFTVTETLRAMEAALDPQGLSTTGRTVMARIMGERTAG